HVRIHGKSGKFHFADSFIRDVLNPSPVDLEITYDYVLGGDARGLRLEVTLKNRELLDAEITWPVLLSNHGDGIRQWVPGVGYGFDFGLIESLTLSGAKGQAWAVVSSGDYELL